MSYTDLPEDLPEPEDDGAADHLPEVNLPSVSLGSTAGTRVDLSRIKGRTVVYCYPLTGRPDRDVVPEGWEGIPGARGCTPQSCAFRDHYSQFKRLGVELYGLSSQTTEYQREAKKRLGLPYELLSDAELRLSKALELPTFSLEGTTYVKRTTLILTDGRIERVFYPVFPPDENPQQVLRWLREHPE